MKNKKHKKVLSIIRAIRLSFLEAGVIYTRGACYGFYTILKSIFPEARAYTTSTKKHIVTRIGEGFYDVQGEFVNEDLELASSLSPLSIREHEYWESVISTQRIKEILKK